MFQWGGKDNWFPGARWPGSLNYVESSRPVREHGSKNNKKELGGGACL